MTDGQMNMYNGASLVLRGGRERRRPSGGRLSGGMLRDLANIYCPNVRRSCDFVELCVGDHVSAG